MRAAPALGERLDPELPYILGQVELAIDEEQAASVEDVLARRVPLLLRSRDQGLAASAKVAAHMAPRLGWSDEEKRRQLDRYCSTVELTRRFRQGQ